MAYERSSGSGIARIVSLVFAIIAVILILHIVLVLADASAASGIVKDLGNLASTLAWGFKNLFSFTSAKTTVFVNYGLAALVYLFVGGALTRLFRSAA
jgi:hypothetical protein